MSQKSKKAEQQQQHQHEEEEILMSQPEKGSTYSMALYLRSFLVIGVVALMFLIVCYFSFMLMDLVTPLFKIGLGLFFGYLLITHEHFQAFRHTLLNPEYGPKTLAMDFVRGFERLVGDYLGHDWMQKMIQSAKRK